MKTKLVAIGTLGLLSFLSLGRNFYNVNADLAAPTGYDYAYKQDFTNYFRVENTVASAYDNPVFTRSGASSPYDYTVTTSVELPMPVSMTFRKSDTGGWTSSGGGYRPGEVFDTTIGSTSASSVVKIEFTFNNLAGSDTWILYIDIPTTTASMTANYEGTQNIDYVYSRSSGTTFLQLVILPFTSLNIYTAATTSARQFDAWYLDKLDGASVAGDNGQYNLGYQTGYDEGYSDGELASESTVTSRIGDLMRTVFSGVGSILDIKVFNDLTMGSLMLFPMAAIVITFVFKLIRGAKG